MSDTPQRPEYLIAPDPGRAGLTRAVRGVDHMGQSAEISVVEERPLTIFLNGQEIVTAMTIGDYPEYLALGFLRNQGMLRDGWRWTRSAIPTSWIHEPGSAWPMRRR